MPTPAGDARPAPSHGWANGPPRADLSSSPPAGTTTTDGRRIMKHRFVIALAAAGIVATGFLGCSKAPSPSTAPSGAASATRTPGAGQQSQMAWQTDDVTAMAAAPAAAFVLPASYVSEARGTQHLIYLGFVDNHLHELWSDASGWHTDDLTAATGAPEPLPDHLVGYSFEAQGTQHVIYVGASDQHIHELGALRLERVTHQVVRERFRGAGGGGQVVGVPAAGV